MAIRLGPFAIGAPVGRGGMGEVWSASHDDGQAVAIKVLTRQGAENAGVRRALQNEVRAVARLDHPHVVRVLDLGVVPEDTPFVSGTPWVAMPLATGSLWPWCGSLDWASVRSVLLAVLDALAHAHARGVLHRDLKPENVLCFGAGVDRVQLTDFGLASVLGERRDPDRETASGTPTYMAPEQVEGRWRDQGPWTDLYAVGQLALDLVGTDTAVPADLEAWVSVMRARDARARFQLACDAAAALGALGGVPSGRAGGVPRAPGLRSLEAATVRFTVFEDVEPEESAIEGPEPAAPGRTVGAVAWKPTPRPREVPWLAGAGLGLFPHRVLPFVGRTAELGRLWDALGQVTAGPRLVFVRGASGTGKSRLLDELRYRAHELGAAAVLAATHRDPPDPGDGLAGALARHLVTVGLDVEATRTRLVRRFGEDPALDGAARLLAGEAVPASVRQVAVGWLLARLATDRPVLLAVDAGEIGVSTLEFLAAWLPRATVPVLVVVALTEDRLARRPAERALVEELGRSDRASRLDLGPLAAAEHRRLIRQTLGFHPEVAGRLEDLARGNPALTVQLVAACVRDGRIEATEHGFRADLTGAAEDELGAWRRAVDDAWPGEAPALEVAAVLGQRVDRETWVGVLGGEPPTAPIDALVAAGLVTADEGVGFAHPLAREALLARARDAGRLSAHHARCAAWLRTHRPGAHEAIGRHLLGAGDVEGAIEPLAEGSHVRVMLGEYGLAEVLLAEHAAAIERLGLVGMDRRWARGELGASRLWWSRGDLDRAARLVEPVIVAARDRGWADVEAKACWALAAIGIERGEQRTVELLERAGDLLEQVGDRTAHGRCRIALCDAELGQGDPARASAALDRASELLGAQDPAVRVRRGRELAMAGRPGEAVALLDGVAAAFATAGQTPMLAFARFQQARAAFLADDLDGASTWISEAADLAVEVGLGEPAYPLWVALIALARGEDPGERLAAIEATVHRAGRLPHRVLVHLALVWRAVRDGDRQGAERWWGLVSGPDTFGDEPFTVEVARRVAADARRRGWNELAESMVPQEGPRGP